MKPSKSLLRVEDTARFKQTDSPKMWRKLGLSCEETTRNGSNALYGRRKRLIGREGV